FANAVLQWLPNHADLVPRLAGFLAPGGVLAVQMPDNLGELSHALMREIALEPRFRGKLAAAAQSRTLVGSASDHYDWLTPHCSRLDIWRTSYLHVLDGAGAIVEWVKGTGLRPFLAPLDANERSAFLAEYEARITAAYPARSDGKVLLPFPRLFVVATR